jgi:predicted AAA+ superfamily ATPase
VGLACSLLGITAEEQLHSHYLKGALFENLVIADTMKNHYNQGLRPSLFFWRDNAGNEIDLIIEHGASLEAVEIKSAKTVHPDFFRGLEYFGNLAQIDSSQRTLIYGGNEDFNRPQGKVRSWRSEEVY